MREQDPELEKLHAERINAMKVCPLDSLIALILYLQEPFIVNTYVMETLIF